MQLFLIMIARIKKHYLAIIIAVLVGFIYIAPNALFIFSLGDQYRGIPMMQTTNEDFYLARMQEIVDGHPLLGSTPFYEYKEGYPLSPPTGELLYSLPSLLFDTSPVSTLVASRFFLIFIFFLLSYYLILGLLNERESFSSKANAIAGALFIILGYDLIDYRSLFNFLLGKNLILANSFLIWSRPVNPILGALFLFSFLIFIRRIIQTKEWRKFDVFGASFFLALMIMSYFFSWGIAVSVLAALIAAHLLKKEFKTVKKLTAVLLFALVLSSPYWLMSWQASKSEWYHDSVLRSGIFYTHYPILNILLLAVLFVYIFAIVSRIFKLKKDSISWHFFALDDADNCSMLENWHVFPLALILGSLCVYSQQIITGVTIWPYHFVQYTIPLAIVAMMVLFYNSIRIAYPHIWKLGIVFLIFSTLLFGVYVQASSYNRFYAYSRFVQSYSTVFDWLNQREKDCVVIAVGETKFGYSLNGLVPALTHCNTYNSNWVYSLLPEDRIYHNYLTKIFFNGAIDKNIEQYVAKNQAEARGWLFSDWKELYGVKQFPDFTNTKLIERIKKIPDDYRNFFKQDIETELKKYRIDYILSDGVLSTDILAKLPNLKVSFQTGNLIIYSFSK